MSHAQTAFQYAVDVINGDIPASQNTVLACQRHKDDLFRTDWQWRFDESLANRACRFIELLPHIKGLAARQKLNITLEPWQCFIVCSLFGWVDRDTKLRRFNEAIIYVARKNGKSTLVSAIALYMLAADNEEGAEVYAAAQDREQARIVFNDAQRMAQKAKGLSEAMGVETSAHSVHVFQTNSRFKALSREQGGNLDGLNAHCAILDELHSHKTSDMYNVLESSMGAREQPLLISISTAGFNLSGIGYQKYDYAIKVTNGAVENERIFCMLFGVDDDDLKDTERLLNDPDVWKKANPNWGVSVKPDFMESQALKARTDIQSRNNFLTKHLNAWTNTETAWCDMQALSDCVDKKITLADFEGEVAFKGCDLASKDDFACDVLLFPKMIDGVTHLYAFAKHYLPEETVEETSNASYRGWAEQGHIILTDGNIIDYDEITEGYLQDKSRFKLRECGFDPYNANQFTSNLISKGLKMVEVPQNVRHLSEPMKELNALIKSGRFHYDGDPVLTWQFSNVSYQEDKNENIFPRKARGQKANKIDGVVALLIALNRYMNGRQETTSIDRVIRNGFMEIEL